MSTSPHQIEMQQETIAATAERIKLIGARIDTEARWFTHCISGADRGPEWNAEAREAAEEMLSLCIADLRNTADVMERLIRAHAATLGWRIVIREDAEPAILPKGADNNGQE